jgi:hypothetical protein
MSTTAYHSSGVLKAGLVKTVLDEETATYFETSDIDIGEQERLYCLTTRHGE